MSNGMLLASDGESGVFLLEPGADAKPGDIVKIIRKSSTASEVVVYRYVIDK